MTLRVRLTLWYVSLLAVMLVAFGLFLYVNLSRQVHREADRSLVLDAQRLIATLDVVGGRPRLGEGSDSLEAGTVAALYDSGGQQLIAASVRQPWPTLGDALGRAARGRQNLTTATFPDGARWRVLTTPVTDENRRVAILQVARNMVSVEAVLTRLVGLMAVAVPVTLLLAVLGGIFLAGRALNPIDRITRTAEQIGAEDLTRRLDLGGTDEVGRLAATFDRMLDRLQSAFERQRQFTTDASHELRTPLAMIASQIDLALDRPRDAPEYREVLISLRQDVTRLNELTSELLTLARAGAGREHLSIEPLDLGKIVEGVVATMQPLARAAGIQLAQHAETGITIAGDQTRLTQMLINLIDNAVKHTPTGGSVRVDAGRDGKSAVVSVSDTGAGIEPEHLPHVFERFYRVESDRSRAAGGSGLGLAIGKWIAVAHGGEIRVTSIPGRGTIFSVSLPLQA